MNIRITATAETIIPNCRRTGCSTGPTTSGWHAYSRFITNYGILKFQDIANHILHCSDVGSEGGPP
jgi:hypothetical protein